MNDPSSVPIRRSPPALARSISKIVVRKLFGEFNYDIPPESFLNFGDLNRVIALYGDNGNGKTTILKLVFHLLSPEPTSGHRSFIAAVPFNRLEVHLNDGTIVTAVRPGDNIRGNYNLAVEQPFGVVASVLCEVTPDNAVRRLTQDSEYNQVVYELEAIDLALFFLADDRRIEGTYIEKRPRFDQSKLIISQRDYFTSQVDSQEHSILVESMDRATDWIRKQAITGTSLGDRNVYANYSDIISQVVESPGRIEDVNSTRLGLLEELADLENRSSEYAKFELASPFDTEAIREALAKANEEQLGIVLNLAKPFLDGIRARLAALASLNSQLQILNATLNRFLGGKSVSFSLSRGFRIYSKSGDLLDPEVLSSGEKHLLLLLLNLIPAHSRASLFIIDEPELSLNIKWQRHLLDALLDNSQFGTVQFLIATHSIELVSQYRESVVKLVSAQND